MESQTGQSSPPISPERGTRIPPDPEGRSFLRRLEELGDGMVSADLPGEPRVILAALLYFIETGSLEPPAPPPTREEASQLSEADAENARLRDRIETLERGSQREPESAPPAVTT